MARQPEYDLSVGWIDKKKKKESLDVVDHWVLKNPRLEPGRAVVPGE